MSDPDRERWVTRFVVCLATFDPALPRADAIRIAHELWSSAGLLPPSEMAGLYVDMNPPEPQCLPTRPPRSPEQGSRP